MYFVLIDHKKLLFYVSVWMTLLVKGLSLEIFAKCTSHNQCPENSLCSPSACDGYTCRCREGYVGSDDNVQCLPVRRMGDQCDGSNKCLSPFSLCEDTCFCNDLLETTQDGRCKDPLFRYVGETCWMDPCQPPAICNDEGMCVCPPGMRQLKNEEFWLNPMIITQCVENDYSVNSCKGKLLEVPLDLLPTTPTVAPLTKPATTSTSAPLAKPATKSTVEPLTKTATLPVPLTTSIQPTTDTLPDTTSVPLYKIIYPDRRFPRRAFEICTNNTQCPENSKCRPRGCMGYVCICDEGYIASDNRHYCLKATKVGQTCDRFQSKCMSPFSYCDGECRCLDVFEPTSDGRCKLPGIGFQGDTCSNSSCEYPAECIDGRCTCTGDYRPVSEEEFWVDPTDLRQCRKKSTSLTTCNGVIVPVPDDMKVSPNTTTPTTTNTANTTPLTTSTLPSTTSTKPQTTTTEPKSTTEPQTKTTTPPQTTTESQTTTNTQPQTTEPQKTTTTPPQTTTESQTTTTTPPQTTTKPQTTTSTPPQTTTESQTTTTTPPQTTEPQKTTSTPPQTTTESQTTTTTPPQTTTKPQTTTSTPPQTTTESQTTTTTPPQTTTESQGKTTNQSLTTQTTRTTPLQTTTEPQTTSTPPPQTTNQPQTTITDPPQTTTETQTTNAAKPQTTTQPHTTTTTTQPQTTNKPPTMTSNPSQATTEPQITSTTSQSTTERRLLNLTLQTKTETQTTTIPSISTTEPQTTTTTQTITTEPQITTNQSTTAIVPQTFTTTTTPQTPIKSETPTIVLQTTTESHTTNVPSSSTTEPHTTTTTPQRTTSFQTTTTAPSPITEQQSTTPPFTTTTELEITTATHQTTIITRTTTTQQIRNESQTTKAQTTSTVPQTTTEPQITSFITSEPGTVRTTFPFSYQEIHTESATTTSSRSNMIEGRMTGTPLTTYTTSIPTIDKENSEVGHNTNDVFKENMSNIGDPITQPDVGYSAKSSISTTPIYESSSLDDILNKSTDALTRNPSNGNFVQFTKPFEYIYSTEDLNAIGKITESKQYFQSIDVFATKSYSQPYDGAQGMIASSLFVESNDTIMSTKEIPSSKQKEGASKTDSSDENLIQFITTLGYIHLTENLNFISTATENTQSFKTVDVFVNDSYIKTSHVNEGEIAGLFPSSYAPVVSTSDKLASVQEKILSTMDLSDTNLNKISTPPLYIPSTKEMVVNNKATESAYSFKSIDLFENANKSYTKTKGSDDRDISNPLATFTDQGVLPSENLIFEEKSTLTSSSVDEILSHYSTTFLHVNTTTDPNINGEKISSFKIINVSENETFRHTSPFAEGEISSILAPYHATVVSTSEELTFTQVTSARIPDETLRHPSATPQYVVKESNKYAGLDDSENLNTKISATESMQSFKTIDVFVNEPYPQASRVAVGDIASSFATFSESFSPTSKLSLEPSSHDVTQSSVSQDTSYRNEGYTDTIMRTRKTISSTGSYNHSSSTAMPAHHMAIMSTIAPTAQSQYINNVTSHHGKANENRSMLYSPVKTKSLSATTPVSTFLPPTDNIIFMPTTKQNQKRIAFTNDVSQEVTVNEVKLDPGKPIKTIYQDLIYVVKRDPTKENTPTSPKHNNFEGKSLYDSETYIRPSTEHSPIKHFKENTTPLQNNVNGKSLSKWESTYHSEHFFQSVAGSINPSLSKPLQDTLSAEQLPLGEPIREISSSYLESPAQHFKSDANNSFTTSNLFDSTKAKTVSSFTEIQNPLDDTVTMTKDLKDKQGNKATGPYSSEEMHSSIIMNDVSDALHQLSSYDYSTHFRHPLNSDFEPTIMSAESSGANNTSSLLPLNTPYDSVPIVQTTSTVYNDNLSTKTLAASDGQNALNSIGHAQTNTSREDTTFQLSGISNDVTRYNVGRTLSHSDDDVRGLVASTPVLSLSNSFSSKSNEYTTVASDLESSFPDHLEGKPATQFTSLHFMTYTDSDTSTANKHYPDDNIVPKTVGLASSQGENGMKSIAIEESHKTIELLTKIIQPTSTSVANEQTRDHVDRETQLTIVPEGSFTGKDSINLGSSMPTQAYREKSVPLLQTSYSAYKDEFFAKDYSSSWNSFPSSDYQRVLNTLTEIPISPISRTQTEKETFNSEYRSATQFTYTSIVIDDYNENVSSENILQSSLNNMQTDELFVLTSPYTSTGYNFHFDSLQTESRSPSFQISHSYDPNSIEEITDKKLTALSKMTNSQLDKILVTSNRQFDKTISASKSSVIYPLLPRSDQFSNVKFKTESSITISLSPIPSSSTVLPVSDSVFPMSLSYNSHILKRLNYSEFLHDEMPNISRVKKFPHESLYNDLTVTRQVGVYYTTENEEKPSISSVHDILHSETIQPHLSKESAVDKIDGSLNIPDHLKSSVYDFSPDILTGFIVEPSFQSEYTSFMRTESPSHSANSYITELLGTKVKSNLLTHSPINSYSEKTYSEHQKTKLSSKDITREHTVIVTSSIGIPRNHILEGSQDSGSASFDDVSKRYSTVSITNINLSTNLQLSVSEADYDTNIKQLTSDDFNSRATFSSSFTLSDSFSPSSIMDDRFSHSTQSIIVSSATFDAILLSSSIQHFSNRQKFSSPSLLDWSSQANSLTTSNENISYITKSILHTATSDSLHGMATRENTDFSGKISSSIHRHYLELSKIRNSLIELQSVPRQTISSFSYQTDATITSHMGSILQDGGVETENASVKQFQHVLPTSVSVFSSNSTRAYNLRLDGIRDRVLESNLLQTSFSTRNVEISNLIDSSVNSITNAFTREFQSSVGISSNSSFFENFTNFNNLSGTDHSTIINDYNKDGSNNDNISPNDDIKARQSNDTNLPVPGMPEDTTTTLLNFTTTIEAFSSNDTVTTLFEETTPIVVEIPVGSEGTTPIAEKPGVTPPKLKELEINLEGFIIPAVIAGVFLINLLGVILALAHRRKRRLKSEKALSIRTTTVGDEDLEANSFRIPRPNILFPPYYVKENWGTWTSSHFNIYESSLFAQIDNIYDEIGKSRTSSSNLHSTT